MPSYIQIASIGKVKWNRHNSEGYHGAEYNAFFIITVHFLYATWFLVFV